MNYWLKVFDFSQSPCCMKKHLAENYEVITFPGKAPYLKKGDKIFFYAAGPGKFFGIATFKQWHDEIRVENEYFLRSKVFISAMLYDLAVAPGLPQNYSNLTASTVKLLTERFFGRITSENDVIFITNAVLKALNTELLMKEDNKKSFKSSLL